METQTNPMLLAGEDVDDGRRPDLLGLHPQHSVGPHSAGRRAVVVQAARQAVRQGGDGHVAAEPHVNHVGQA